MSSYYTAYYMAADLEAERKAQLKKALNESIQKLKEQMLADHSDNVQIAFGSNIKRTVYAADNVISGYNKSAIVTGAMLLHDDCQSSIRREELDFSELLSSSHKPTKLEQELDSWIRKADERPIITEKDEMDRTRLFSEVAKIIQSATTDIEDKLKFVKMRVSSYLQGAIRITDADKEKMEWKYYEYCALCDLLETQPTEKLPSRIEKEVNRMMAILEKRSQDEYVMNVIDEIMEDLGCYAKDEAVLDHTVGQMYSVDGHPLVDVFIGKDGSGIMFEPVGVSKEGSLEERRRLENSANSICSLYTVIEERAAKKGVILNRVYIEPINVEEMIVQSDISMRGTRKKQKRTAAKKQQALNSEG